MVNPMDPMNSPQNPYDPLRPMDYPYGPGGRHNKGWPEPKLVAYVAESRENPRPSSSRDCSSTPTRPRRRAPYVVGPVDRISRRRRYVGQDRCLPSSAHPLVPTPS